MRKTTRIHIVPDGKPIFDENAIEISVEDDGAGAFFVLRGGEDGCRIDFDEWNEIDSTVRALIKEHK